MKNYLHVAAALLFVSAPALSQLPVSSPSPTIDNDVVKISTNLIQVDVTVTDLNGKPISDLKPNEIEIYENGQKQKLSNFSFIAYGQPVVEKKPKVVDKYAVPLPPAKLRPENVRRTIAIVVDDLSLSWESIAHTRDALKKFVNEQMQEGDMVAIIRTGSGIGALQQFTADKRILYAAIDKVKYNPLGTGGISAFAPMGESEMPTVGSGAGGAVTATEAQADENFQNEFDDIRASTFAAGTLGALQYIVGGVRDLPGRKSVILFSDGFRLFERDREGTPRSGLVMQFMDKLIDQANREAVVFYAVDPRGLQYFGLTAADNTRGMRPADMNKAVDTRRNNMWESQSGITYLAKQTGGFAVMNNNDLSGGVRKVLDDQSYYLLGYIPDSETFDPVKIKFNKLEVKVLRKGATVRYRNGFFTRPEANNVAATPPITPAGVTDPSKVAQLEHALYSPFGVSGITLRLTPLFGSNGDGLSYVRSLLHIDARDLKFTDEPDGSKTAAFDVLATCFGDNGQLVDQLGKSYTMTVKPDVYKKILTEGFVYHFKFPVKKAGAYQYRVALRDSTTGLLGSASEFLQVPDLRKNRLALSSIVFENLTLDEYQRTGMPDTANTSVDPMTDTAVRQIRAGRVFRYSLEIYNTKLDATKHASLQTKVRVFREGKLILDGQPKPFELRGQTNMQHLRFFGGLGIGSQMEVGDYVMQIIVIDNLADQKHRIATQSIPFEVIQ
jgi:VWFA-related protein